MEVVEKTRHLERRKSGKKTYNVARSCPMCDLELKDGETLPHHLRRRCKA